MTAASSRFQRQSRQLLKSLMSPLSFCVCIRTKAADPIALETAIVRYGPTTMTRLIKTAHVDLVAAVHIGEKEYFSTLNQLFQTYDVVLYELVAPPNATSSTRWRPPFWSNRNCTARSHKATGAFSFSLIRSITRHEILSTQIFHLKSSTGQCNVEESPGGQCFQKSWRKAWPARMKIPKNEVTRTFIW